MKTLIIGANGQLGSELVKTFEHVAPLTHQDVEVCDLESVRAALRQHWVVDLVINTAAYHKVSECEADPTTAFAVNAVGARNVALACKEIGCCTLVHLSTDYVFDGQKDEPYVEEDEPCPVNVYGWSKWTGELLVRSALERHFVVRTSALFGLAGSSGKGGNFVETMLRLAEAAKPVRVVTDQVTSPTYAADLARQIKALVFTTRHGTYHIAGHGSCSWHEFAVEIFRQSGLHPEVVPVSSEEFGAAAPRPRYSALRNVALERLGLDRMRPWQKGLADYLETRRRR